MTEARPGCEVRDGLRNTGYRTTFRSGTGRFYYYFAKDAAGWYQVTASGNRHKATAEQVLNHMLPAPADVKRGVVVEVDYTPEPDADGV